MACRNGLGGGQIRQQATSRAGPPLRRVPLGFGPHLDMLSVDAFRHSLCCWDCKWIASDCIENILQWSCADGLRAVLFSTGPCCFLFYELFRENPIW